MTRKAMIGGISLCFVLLFILSGVSGSKKQVIFINEVRSWDAGVQRNDHYGSDYIELYNASSQRISLEGWYLSDDETDLKKCRLYDVSIEAKGYRLLYADGKRDRGDSMNFKIASSGEKLFLSDAEGNLVDSVYVPEQEFGTVYARNTDGGRPWCVKAATENSSNDRADILPVPSLEKPKFSHESGCYDKPFTLTLEAAPGETIYYTLDGNIPTKDSPVYRDGIFIEDISRQPNVCNAVQNVVQDWQDYTPVTEPVDKAVIVRAVAMDEGRRISKVATNTYFIGDRYRDRKVLSVVADYQELFGEEGILVTGKNYDDWYLSGKEGEAVLPNFLQRGRAWEIWGNLQMLDQGKAVLNQEAGIRTQGASNRLIPRKPMSIYARKEYSGSQYLDDFTIKGHRVHSISTNAWVANAVLPELLEDRDVAIQGASEAVVFLNGEYWYDSYLLEKYDKYYLEENYGVDRNNVMIIKNHSVEEGPENSVQVYEEVLDFIKTADLSREEAYSQLEQMIDMQSYMDYFCANVYLANMDLSEEKNYVLWRTIEKDGSSTGDGRWRWMLYDMDCIQWLLPESYGVQTRQEINSFAVEMEYTKTAMNRQSIFAAAKKNEQFCRRFVLTFMDMANVNFSMEHVKEVFVNWGEAPWFLGGFFEERFDYIVPDLAEEFELKGTLEEVTLKVNDTEGGRILLNTTEPDLSKGSWTGRYYTDYPVTATAVPEDGYEFTGWKGSVTSQDDTIEAEVTKGGITLEAVFEKTAE